MATHLAAEISKYFIKRGNARIFRNGLSQNKTAEKIAEELSAGASTLADEKGVDQSVFSKVVKGERLFSPKQLDAFCRAVGLSEEENQLIKYALAKDYCEGAGIGLNLDASPPVLSIVIGNLQQVSRLVETGELNFALEMLAQLLAWQRGLDTKAHLLPPTVRVLTWMQIEREKVITMLANSQLSVNLDAIRFIDIKTNAELLSALDDLARLDLLDQIVDLGKHLSEFEQRIWQMYYRHRQTVSEIAKRTAREEMAIETILLNARGKIMDYMVSTTPDMHNG